MDASLQHLLHDQTTRTLDLLKCGTKRKFENQDIEIMSILKQELEKFSQNINAAGDWNTTDTLLSITPRSIDYLSVLLQNSSSTTSSRTPPSIKKENLEITKSTQIEMDAGIITFSIEKGRKIFFIDGQPIQFKILKNKPKNGAFQSQWNSNFHSLVDFKRVFGHTRVTRTTLGYEELGNWVAEQRRKLKKGKITQNQFEMLNDIDFEWDRSHYFFNTYQSKKKLKASSMPDLLSKSFSA